MARREVEALRELGLSEYEARAYAALLAMGEMTPREVSLAAGIPYTKVYEVLRRLEAKGWVRRLSKGPLLYAPRRPEVIIDELRASLEKRLNEAERVLRDLEESGIRSVAPAGVYIVRKPGALRRILKSLVMGAREEVLALASTDELLEVLRLAPRRPERVKCIVRAGLALPHFGEWRVAMLLLPLPLDILISDRERLVLSFGLLKAEREPKVSGVVVVDKEVAETAASYFHELWKMAGSKLSGGGLPRQL